MGSQTSGIIAQFEEVLETKNLIHLGQFISQYPLYINSRLFNKGTNALCRAANLESLPMIEMLVDHGADINQQSANGNTPLMWAARNNDVHILMYLISKKAKINIKNEEGLNAMDLAVYNLSYDSAAILQNCGLSLKPDEFYRSKLGSDFKVCMFRRYILSNEVVNDASIFYDNSVGISIT